MVDRNMALKQIPSTGHISVPHFSAIKSEKSTLLQESKCPPK
jgi:hypothetical protein